MITLFSHTRSFPPTGVLILSVWTLRAIFSIQNIEDYRMTSAFEIYDNK